MLYVDKTDRNVRWEAFVRRKFDNGVWIWAAGPADHWDTPADHHAYICNEDCRLWRETQHCGLSHVVLPMLSHLRYAYSSCPCLTNVSACVRSRH